MPIVLITPQPVQNTLTSGTVGATVIDTASVIEHAFRRVKVHPAMQTPETVRLAKENLYLVLTSLVARGLNLWCLQTDLIGLEPGKAEYDMVAGTVSVLNVIYSQPSRATGTDIVDPVSVTTDLLSPTSIKRIGLKFASTPQTNTILLEHSQDGINWTAIDTITRADFDIDTWFWIALDKIPVAQYFRAVSTAPVIFSEFYLASGIADLPVIQWNRDTWSTINNKFQQGHPSTNYYLERLLNPRITLWPVPDNNFSHLQLFVQRQIQDIGSLAQAIEIPQRWFEAVIWQLALRLAFELPNADPNAVSMVMAMAEKTLMEVEKEESDGAPMTLLPRISVYTR